MKVVVLIVFGLTHCFSVGVIAQSKPCTTPTNQPGVCVPLQNCRNIYSIIQGNKKPSQGILNYIRRSVCQLAGVSKAVCCQPTEVEHTAHIPTNIKSLLPTDCGSTTADRIAYGERTAIFEYPWMVLVRYKNFNKEIVDGCGGSLINARYVLTAAHCIKSRQYILDHVRLGEHNKITEIDCDKGDDAECAGPVQDVRIEAATVHPQYNIPQYRNDIGLIRMARVVTFEDHIRPICLPATPAFRNMLHAKYILTGWGTTEQNALSSVLLQATLPRIENTQCERIMESNDLPISLSSQQMCAGGQNLQDSCRGDSGGPLGTVGIVNDTPRFIQFGIVSIGVNTCGHKVIPSIYTRVGEYMDWILNTLKP